MERAPYQNETLRSVLTRLNRSKMCERIGAMPAPPPMKIISFLVSRAKNSPNGPEMMTSSPGLRLKMYDDIRPGGASGSLGGGVAMRTLSMMTPYSSG